MAAAAAALATTSEILFIEYLLLIVPHKLFSQSRLQTYLSNKELGFGRQVYDLRTT